VTVAGGDKLHSGGSVQVCAYQILGCRYCDTFFPLEGARWYLEVDWPQILDELTLKLSKEGGTWEFKGVQDGTLEVVQAKIMDRTMFLIAKGWVIYICSKEEPITTSLQDEINPKLEALCRDFCYSL